MYGASRWAGPQSPSPDGSGIPTSVRSPVGSSCTSRPPSARALSTASASVMRIARPPVHRLFGFGLSALPLASSSWPVGHSPLSGHTGQCGTPSTQIWSANWISSSVNSYPFALGT